MTPLEIPPPNNPDADADAPWVSDKVTFPPAGPYTASYGVDSLGLANRNGKRRIVFIVLEVNRNDPAGVIAKLTFTSNNGELLTDRFTKTEGPCADNPPELPSTTVTVSFPVPDTTASECEWSGRLMPAPTPFIKVVVRTKRV